MRKLYSLEIRGKRKEWGFPVWVDPEYVEEWRADGLKVEEILNTIPEWWVNAGFSVRLWCFFQDLFSFRNPFASQQSVQRTAHSAEFYCVCPNCHIKGSVELWSRRQR